MQSRDLVARHLGHFRVFQHLIGLRQGALVAQEAFKQCRNHADLGVLARERAETVHVLDHFGLLQEEVEFLEADGVAFELLAEEGFHRGALSLRAIPGGILRIRRNPGRGRWGGMDAGSSPA